MENTLGAKLPRRLGRNGLEVPALGLGGAGIGGVWADLAALHVAREHD